MNKSTRRTRAETRELVVSAALDLVRAHGLGAEPTTITYQKVFDHILEQDGIRITRASVHERLWSSQEEFQAEVLLRVSRMQTGLGEAANAAAETLRATAEMPPIPRMREVARLAPNAVLSIAADDPLFHSWVGFTLSLAKDSVTQLGTRGRLAERAAAEYTETESRATELIAALAGQVGVRPRQSLFKTNDEGYLLVARLGLTLAEGATVRNRFDKSELPDVQLLTGEDGEAQTWTAFAAGFWALLNTFLEVDPDAGADRAE